MQMKLSNAQVENGVRVLNSIYTEKIEAITSWKIGFNLLALEPVINLFNKEKEKVINKFIVKDDEGKIKTKEDGSIIFKDEEKCNKEYKELSEIETEIEVKQIKLEDLKGVKISAADLYAIRYMIIE